MNSPNIAPAQILARTLPYTTIRCLMYLLILLFA